MAHVMALRHVAFEDLGLLQPMLEGLGFTVTLQDAWAPLEAAAQADLLVVLGGPIGVYETRDYPFLARETAMLRERLAANRPTLGICLGAQLMAAALGARVYPGPAKEIGWAPLTLSEAGRLSPLGEIGTRPVLHWHGDTFDLPAGAVRLASTALAENQAFSLGPNQLGLQFHVEADPARIEAWLVGHTAELNAAGIDLAGLRAASAVHGPALTGAARAFLHRWLAGLDLTA